MKWVSQCVCRNKLLDLVRTLTRSVLQRVGYFLAWQKPRSNKIDFFVKVSRYSLLGTREQDQLICLCRPRWILTKFSLFSLV
jgi:hypothetical protein